MGLTSTVSHHRRRSSVLVGDRVRSHSESGEPYDERTDGIDEGEEEEGGNRLNNGHTETKPPPISPDDPVSDQSSTDDSSVELELDDMASDDPLNDDEETGLTAKERRQRRRRRRRQRRELDARIANVKISESGRRLADQNVVKKLVFNAVLIGLWYIFSLSISIYNKWMFSSDHLNFHFPLFTTSLHMAVQFTLAGTILYFFPSLRPRDTTAPDSPTLEDTQSKPLMTKMFYLTRLVPCGTATSLDVGLGNMSLKFISLTFLTMCKSSALAFVLLFAFLFKLETPSLKLIFIITTMTVGVIMMVAGEAAFNALGFTLVIASAFFSGFRWGLTQILLLRHPATSNPFSTLFFLTPIMFVSLIIIAIPVEGPSATAEGISILVAEKGLFTAILLLIFPGVLAFCMIASEFALLQRSSVVTLSICGIFKEVITISAAGIVFHDPLTPINISGLIVTIGSIASYNYIKIKKMRRDARLDVADNANQTDTDSDMEDAQRLDSQPDSRASSRLGNYGGSGRDGVYQALLSPSNAEPDNNKININVIPPHDSLDRGRRSLRGKGDNSFGMVPAAVAGVKQEEMNDGRSSPRLRSVGPNASGTPVAESSTENRGQQGASGHRRRSSSMESWSSTASLPRSKKERIRDLG
ncbi:Triose-phosphate Transporter [Arachnomyces sp. PD_36]|nr:Triose-phosphate Transporter [Arachnomyces sp. PD_36]